MKHEFKLNKNIFIGLMIIFCIGNLTVNSVRMEPGIVLLNSSKDNKNNRVHAQTTNSKELDDIKKALVIIKSRPEVPFISDTDEIITATGFIVDMEKGLIVTTRKAARLSPAFIKIQFYDGTIRKGKVVYSDNIVPFGIIKINLSMWEKEKSKYTSLKLGNCYDESFRPNLEVEMIGMGVEGTYITKKGKIINSNRNFSSRYGSLFQTSFDRANNLNGSPVLNSKKEVIGLHVIATTTTSYELKINHISTILSHISKDEPIKKGDIGISIDLVILGIAKSNYKLKDEIADEISKNIIISGGPPEVMLISSVFPASSAFNILKSGDIIYKVNGVIVANDFLKLEEQINSSLSENKTLAIEVSRNSEILKVQISKIDNNQDYAVDKYISFSGAYFHDVTKLVKYYLFSDLEGVYLTYNNVGSPFSKIAVSNQFFKNNCELESMYLEGIDYNIFSGKLNSDAVDLDFNNSLLQKFIYSKSSFKWDVESLDLKQYCKSAKKTEEKKPLAVTANRESALNNSTNTNNNNNGEDYNSNITEEIANIDENTLNFIKNSNNNKNAGNSNTKRSASSGYTDTAAKSALLNENANEKIFENQPVIEKKAPMKLNSEEALGNAINSKAANVTISSKIAAAEDKAKKLESLNEFKFKEKMNKLKTETKIKIDISAQRINVNNHQESAEEKRENTSKQNINKKIQIKLNSNLNLTRNNTNASDVYSNFATESYSSLEASNNKTNIKEEEVKIKERKKPVESSKLIEVKKINGDFNSNRTVIGNKNNNVTTIEFLKMTDEKVEAVKQKVEKINSEIEKHLQMQVNNTNVTLAPALNSTMPGKKGKENDKKNQMLQHLIHLHKFGI